MENNTPITRAEVKVEIQNQLGPVKKEMNNNFEKIREEQHGLFILFTEQKGFLQQIADNTAGLKESMNGVTTQVKDIDDRVEAVENEYELKIENQKGKWALLKVFFGAGGLITIITLYIIQILGGFPTT